MNNFGKNIDSPSPVVSFTLIDCTDKVEEVTLSLDSHIQVVVRRPSTNKTHPNVISVPTHRIPVSLLGEILSTGSLVSSHGRTAMYQSNLFSNLKDRGHNPIIYTVENILAKKLEVGALILSGKLVFSAYLQSASIGKAYYANLPPGEQEEYIHMVNIRVNIFSGVSMFPANTASYSYVLWPKVSEFIRLVDSNNPLTIGEFLNPIDYCIHGLCVSTTYDSILNNL